MFVKVVKYIVLHQEQFVRVTTRERAAKWLPSISVHLLYCQVVKSHTPCLGESRRPKVLQNVTPNLENILYNGASEGARTTNNVSANIKDTLSMVDCTLWLWLNQISGQNGQRLRKKGKRLGRIKENVQTSNCLKMSAEKADYEISFARYPSGTGHTGGFSI